MEEKTDRKKESGRGKESERERIDSLELENGCREYIRSVSIFRPGTARHKEADLDHVLFVRVASVFSTQRCRVAGAIQRAYVSSAGSRIINQDPSKSGGDIFPVARVGVSTSQSSTSSSD